MKNLAKLALFFSSSFIIIFFAVLLIRIFDSWVEMARLIPVVARSGGDLILLAWRTLPISIFLSILLSLSYSGRKKTPIPSSMLCIIILASIFMGGFAMGINRADALNTALNPVYPIRSGPGLVLNRSGSAIVLLRESSDIRGPRVVSFPGEPLIYQELPLGPNNSIIPLPPMPLGEERPWFIRSIEIDYNLTSSELRNRFYTDIFSFAAYAFSLILLLSSLRFILEKSLWPLANIFLGALIFRGILALEVFLNTPEINRLIYSFLAERVPPMYISPMAFCTLAILIILYTLLACLARPRRHWND